VLAVGGWLLLGMMGCSRQGAVETPPDADRKGPNYTPLAMYERDSQVRPATFEATISRNGAVAFSEPTEQELAAQALGRIGKPAVPLLMNALQHRDPLARRQAALVLAKIGPEAAEAVPLLVGALDDQDAAVRRAAAKALGQIGPAAQDAVPALMRSLVQPE
jgi:HEAT repeat protein